MDKKAQFFDFIKKEMVMTLATASQGRVTMRTVSPVYFDGAILMFTCADSLKYKQLEANPNCCVAVGPFFAEATVKLLGGTMLDCNEVYRDAYCAKFPGAFDENVEFGGRKADFILLTPVRLSGWGFSDDTPTADGIPNLPFDIAL